MAYIFIIIISSSTML